MFGADANMMGRQVVVKVLEPALRLDQDVASRVMGRRRSSRGAGEGPSSPALRPIEEAALREAVANLATLDLAGLPLQWRNVFGGSAPVHLPKPLLASAHSRLSPAGECFRGSPRYRPPDARRLRRSELGPRRPSGRGQLVVSATDQTRLHPGSRMGWPSPARHGAGKRLRLGRQEPTAASPRSRAIIGGPLERAEVLRPHRIQGDGARGRGDRVH